MKEAIPELYLLPELLVNATGLDLGRPQSTGTPLSDVELPPWAHGDPWEFVRRHREALESEHVSLRLHAWIDLVFGCRQRPPALNRGRRGAVESCNVFFHLTYPGAVDLPRLREQDPQVNSEATNIIGVPDFLVHPGCLLVNAVCLLHVLRSMFIHAIHSSYSSSSPCVFTLKLFAKRFNYTQIILVHGCPI